jgi:predicted amidohydrolase
MSNHNDVPMSADRAIVQSTGEIILRTLVDGKVHRVVFYPGEKVDDAPECVRDAASSHWTPQVVSQWRSRQESGPNFGPSGE